MANINYCRMPTGKLWYVYHGKFESPCNAYYNRIIMSDHKKVWLKKKNVIVVEADEKVRTMLFSVDTQSVELANCILEGVIKNKKGKLINCI